MGDNNARAITVGTGVTTTFATILPFNQDREMLFIENRGTDEINIFIGELTDATLADSIPLSSGECLDIHPASVFPVNIAATATTANVVITEG